MLKRYTCILVITHLPITSIEEGREGGKEREGGREGERVDSGGRNEKGSKKLKGTTGLE